MRVRDKGQEMIEQEGEKEGNGPHPCETVKSIPSLQDLRIERKVSYLNLFQRRNLIMFLGGGGMSLHYISRRNRRLFSLDDLMDRPIKIKYYGQSLSTITLRSRDREYPRHTKHSLFM